MSSVENELFAKLKAIRDADTSGGLGDPADPSYVPVFVRSDDPDQTRDNSNWPRIEVQVLNTPAQDLFARGSHTVDFRMYIKFDRDPGFARADAVLTRIRLKYHRVALGSGTTFNFSTCRLTNIVTLQPGGKELSRVVFFRTLAQTASGV